MLFKRINPASVLERIIECYWIVEDADTTPVQQKIIPDGFTEIIFHYGDPYRIRLDNTWEVQSKSLLAGQIDKFFFLENTGASGIIGIKMRPTALTHLYGLDMHTYKNKVFDLHRVLPTEFKGLEKEIQSAMPHEEKIALLNEYFTAVIRNKEIVEGPVDRAVELILSNHGMVGVALATKVALIGERQLENLFRKCVGLSPKLFARIIRFSYIFQLIREDHNWSDLAYEAAFYDQSHFIRNFRNFTGENPADYAFEEKNLANFFLRKTES